MKYWYDRHRNLKQADQIFLEKYLWDIVKQNMTAHDSFFCDKFDGIPFPTRRPDSFYCHVGGYGNLGLKLIFLKRKPSSTNLIFF